jgi:hypothetical protein
MLFNIPTTFFFTALPMLASAQSEVAESLRRLNCVGSTGYAGGGLRPTFYVPETGQICEMLECGGGRAPPRQNLAGCNQYTGTETYTKISLPGWGPNGKIAVATESVATSIYAGPSIITPAPKTGDSRQAPATGTRANNLRVSASATAKPVLYTGGGNIAGGSIAAVGFGILGAIAAL